MRATNLLWPSRTPRTSWKLQCRQTHSSRLFLRIWRRDLRNSRNSHPTTHSARARRGYSASYSSACACGNFIGFLRGDVRCSSRDKRTSTLVSRGNCTRAPLGAGLTRNGHGTRKFLSHNSHKFFLLLSGDGISSMKMNPANRQRDSRTNQVGISCQFKTK